MKLWIPTLEFWLLFGTNSDGTYSTSDITKVAYGSGNYVVVPGCTDESYLGTG